MAIYTGLEATLHEAFWGDRGSDLEVKDILRLFPDFQGRALEVGAGSGRILLPLSEQGWQMTGIEPSSEMVEMFNAKEHGQSAHMEEVTIEDYKPAEPYDLVLLSSYVFQLLETPDEILDKLKQITTPSGLVYLSLMIPWAEIVGELVEGEWLLDDEIKLPGGKKARCWVNFELDRIGQRLTRQHRYEIFERKTSLGATRTEQKIRWYTMPEMELLLDKYGFEIVDRSYEFGSDYDSDAHSLGLVLRKH